MCLLQDGSRGEWDLSCVRMSVTGPTHVATLNLTLTLTLTLTLALILTLVVSRCHCAVLCDFSQCRLNVRLPLACILICMISPVSSHPYPLTL